MAVRVLSVGAAKGLVSEVQAAFAAQQGAEIEDIFSAVGAMLAASAIYIRHPYQSIAGSLFYRDLSNGFVGIFTFTRSMPLPSSLTRTDTFKSARCFTATIIFKTSPLGAYHAARSSLFRKGGPFTRRRLSELYLAQQRFLARFVVEE